MKRIIFMLLGCAVLALTSCSKSTNESIPTLTPAEIVGDYNGSKLSVMVNGNTISVSSVGVEGTAMNDMSVKLPTGIAGQTEVVVKPVIFSQGEGDVCKFTGKTSANGYDVVVDGVVLNKKLSLSVFVTTSQFSAKDFVGTYDAAKASVKVSGVAYDLSSSQAFEISGTNVSDMTVKVPAGVVPGEDELIFSKVAFKLGNDCQFSGVLAKEECTFNLQGGYANGNISVSITPEYKTALVGVWNFEKPNVKEGSFEDLSRVMICKVETPSGKVNFFFGEQDQEYMDVFFNGLLGQMMLRSYNEAGEYTGALQNITFHADGNLTAEYNNKFMSGAEFVKSPMNAMRWYLKGGKLFLIPNVNMMTKGSILKDGLPMEIKLEGDKVTIYATKTQVMPLMSLVSPIIQGIPDEVFGDFAMLAKALVGELEAMTKEATRFDLGVCFEKTK